MLNKGHHKEAALLGLLLVGLAIAFWSGSRYPDLSAKAFMGGETLLEDPLSFEVLISLQEGDSLIRRMAVTTINWVNTNKKGMFFGVLMGAALLSLLQLIDRRQVKGSFANALIGMVLGAPLGVCVNCAAPIAKGLNDGGARLETTLATMFSSPTLNFVALTMMFSIFPGYLAGTRILFTVLFIALILPILCKTLFRTEMLASVEAASCPIPTHLQSTDASWGRAATNACKHYFKSLFTLSLQTVPLMFLAGLMGSVMATLLPLEAIANSFLGPVGLVAITLVGLFLPVPIAFDIVVSGALLAAGMPILYVGTLLFVLGIYSVYSYFIVAISVSHRVAGTLFIALAMMGILSGVTTDFIHDQAKADMLVALENMDGQNQDLRQIEAPTLALNMENAGQKGQSFTVHTQSIPHAERSVRGSTLFESKDPMDFSLHRPNDFTVDDYWPPFYNGRGIAAGDFNEDGWIDLLFATGAGLHLYENRGGKDFQSIPLEIEDLGDLNIFIVAFVDLDNDGDLDIFFSTYRQGNYFILNDGGTFTAEGFYQAPAGDQILTYSASFADIDADGDLDAALGNWFFGFGKPIPPLQAENRLLVNEGGHYQSRRLKGPTGETLSTLFTDYTQDGHIDLIMGNDFVQPDIYYWGNGHGDFTPLKAHEGIPISTTTTMSIDTGDLNNDLKLDIYAAQIAARATQSHAKVVTQTMDDYCADIQDPLEAERCEANIDIKRFFNYGAKHNPEDSAGCMALRDEEHKRQCLGMMLMKTAIREKDIALCDHLPPGTERTQFICKNYFAEPVKTSQRAYRDAIRSMKNVNVLLMAQADGQYSNEAEEQGVSVTGWSWNAKIADLNNDEWQDIYVVNGSWLRAGASPSNRFFLNDAGQGFSDQTEAFGLMDYRIVSAYVYIDFDNDGDLDVLTNSVNGPLRLYQNGSTDKKSISFEFRDDLGNTRGIGNKIIITYGENEAHQQIREMKSGGGFLSFDAYRLHFGLGEFQQVNRIEIEWSTGEKSTLDGPFEAGHHHILRRRAKDSPTQIPEAPSL